MTQPDPDTGAPVTHFAYNSDGMLASVTDPAGNTTSFVYDGADCVRQVVYADGTHVQLDPSDEEALPAAYSGTGTSADPFPVLYAGRPSSTDVVDMA